MNDLTLAVVLDIIAKAGALGSAALTIWALITERLLPRGRLDATTKLYEERLAYRQKLIEQHEATIAKLTAELNRVRSRR